MPELCELDGMNRKTGYQWSERYLRRGPQGREERSRKPGSRPNQIPE